MFDREIVRSWSIPIGAVGLSLLFAAGLIGAGCGDATGTVTVDPATELPTTKTAIRNGSVDRSHKSVVGIARGSTSSRRGTCTGTLIAPNLVLTAQHCVANLSSPRVACGRTQFGTTKAPRRLSVTTDTYMYRQGASYYDVRSVHVPRGDSAFCGRDIALLTLSQNIPSSVTEPIPPRLESPVSRGESYTAVGFGLDGRSGAGVRRIRKNRTVAGKVSRTVDVRDGGGTVRKTVTEIRGDSGVCRGDSGSGALDSQGRVFGTLSRGRPVCRTSIYTGIYEWRGWIRSVARQAANDGGYQTPSWVNPNGSSGTTGGSSTGSSSSGTTGGSSSSSGSGGSSSGGSSGKTCDEVYTCIADCAQGDQNCVNTCFRDGTSEAQRKYRDLSQCYSDNCKGGTQSCLQNQCGTELDACRGDAGGTTSGGSGDGGSGSGGSSSTGGSSAGTSGSTSGGSSGGSKEAPATCRGIDACKQDCSSRSCRRGCYQNAAPEAKRRYYALLKCYQRRCDDASNQTRCLQYYCRSELSSCLEQ